MKPNEQPGVAVNGDAADLVDCWNRIGVMGDGSCTKLAEVVHCRNCQVYAGARAQLLDRQLPAGYRREWTQHFSQARTPVTAGRISVVVFRIGEEWLALSTQTFHEVIEPRPIHSLPHRKNSSILGLVNFRGELLICVSLARMLGMHQKNHAEKTGPAGVRLMIVEWQERFLAFPVDEILGIHRYVPGELKPLPATVAHSASSFAQGILHWQNRAVGCLDEERLFTALSRGFA